MCGNQVIPTNPNKNSASLNARSKKNRFRYIVHHRFLTQTENDGSVMQLENQYFSHIVTTTEAFMCICAS